MGWIRKGSINVMMIMVSLFGLASGFITGCIYVLMSRLIHKKRTFRHNAGFSCSDSVKLQADSRILRSGRAERSAGKYRMEDQES